MRKPIGLVGITVLVMAIASGCATPPSHLGLVAGSALTIGEAGQLVSVNPGVYGSPAGERAAADLAELTRPQFYQHDSQGTLVANPDFGTVKRATDNTVTYTLSGKAKWSDGVPVDAADLVVSWLAARDTQLPGYSSYLHRTSLSLADKLTLLPDGVKLHYTAPVPDWQTALPLTVPAHLLGKVAEPNANLTDAAAEKLVTDVAAGADSGATVALLETAFASGFTTTSNGSGGTTVDSKLLLTAGAYTIESATANKVVLLANKNYTAGPKATVAKVVINCYQTADDLLRAIQTSQVDLAAPRATSMYDLAKVESDAKGAGYQTASGDSGINEVALLNYGPGSSFKADTWGGNKDQLKAAIDGAFKFLPRAGMWNVLAGTPGLSKSNSLVFSVADGNYGASVADNGTSKYPFQDAEASVEAWQAAKFPHTIALRVLFDANSPRGQLEYTQLSRLGKLGGFNVQNVSSDTPDTVLASGQWDIYLVEQPQLTFGGSALATSVGALTGFQNSAVNELVAQVAAGEDLSKNAADAKKLDQLLVNNFYGLPLFQLDGVVIWSSALSNYAPLVGNQNLTWGYSNWSVLAKGK